MLLSGVVSDFPPPIDYRTFPDFNDAVASIETSLGGRLDEVDVCPLKPVVVDIVGNFAEQHTITA